MGAILAGAIALAVGAGLAIGTMVTIVTTNSDDPDPVETSVVQYGSDG
jgi:Asp/Glu/hydantoin racemase